MRIFTKKFSDLSYSCKELIILLDKNNGKGSLLFLLENIKEKLYQNYSLFFNFKNYEKKKNNKI
jgi:hypothetical protein